MPMPTVPATLPSRIRGAPARRVNGTTVPVTTPTTDFPWRPALTVS